MNLQKMVELFERDMQTLSNYGVKFNNKLADTIHEGSAIIIAGGSVDEVIDAYRALVKNDTLSKGTFKIIRSYYNTLVRVLANLTNGEKIDLLEEIRAIKNYRKLYELMKLKESGEAGEAEATEAEATEAEAGEAGEAEAGEAEAGEAEAGEVTIDDIMDLLTQIENKAVELPAYKLVTLKSMLENLIKAL